MQVRIFPTLVLPRLPTNTSQRQVTPVPAIPVTRNRQSESSDAELLVRQNQRYSYVKMDTEGSRTSRALQTYFNIETQAEQERSQTLFGVDILA